MKVHNILFFWFPSLRPRRPKPSGKAQRNEQALGARLGHPCDARVATPRAPGPAAPRSRKRGATHLRALVRCVHPYSRESARYVSGFWVPYNIN